MCPEVAVRCAPKASPQRPTRDRVQLQEGRHFQPDSHTAKSLPFAPPSEGQQALPITFASGFHPPRIWAPHRSAPSTRRDPTWHPPLTQPVPPIVVLKSGRPLSCHQEGEFDGQSEHPPFISFFLSLVHRLCGVCYKGGIPLPRPSHPPLHAQNPERPRGASPTPWPNPSHPVPLWGPGVLFSAAHGRHGGLTHSNPLTDGALRRALSYRGDGPASAAAIAMPTSHEVRRTSRPAGKTNCSLITPGIQTDY